MLAWEFEWDEENEEKVRTHSVQPMAKTSKRALKRIPAFRSEDEEARWYGDHRKDLHEYIDMADAEVVESQPNEI
jgi:hypothetical protein